MSPAASPGSASPGRTLDPHRHRRVDVRLREALESGTLPKDLLICGPAGTGKTYAILTALHTLLADYRGLRALICRQTRASLTESSLVTLEQEVLPADGMERIAADVLRRVRQAYTYPSGSELVVGGLDNPTRVLSTAWDFIFVNEAIEISEEVWESLGSRLNRPGRDPRFGFLVGDTNPGNPAHWLLSRVKAGRTALWDTAHEANPALHDGRGWTPAGKAYRARLDGLSGTRRARLRDGLWAVGEGLWFDAFDPGRVVTTEAAEYDPSRPVYLAIDPGVFTGAVLFQASGDREHRRANVIADYLAEGRSAAANAAALLALVAERSGGRLDAAYADPAGGARTAIGPTVADEYRRAGLRLHRWPLAPVADGLELVESCLHRGQLTIHPRCEHLTRAFGGYVRARRQNQWMDYPEDPQHPHEDVMDALRGGLFARFPGRLVLSIT
jgi:DNA polymerase III delta prime subunit